MTMLKRFTQVIKWMTLKSKLADLSLEGGILLLLCLSYLGLVVAFIMLTMQFLDSMG